MDPIYYLILKKGVAKDLYSIGKISEDKLTRDLEISDNSLDIALLV